MITSTAWTTSNSDTSDVPRAMPRAPVRSSTTSIADIAGLYRTVPELELKDAIITTEHVEVSGDLAVESVKRFQIRARVCSSSVRSRCGSTA